MYTLIQQYAEQGHYEGIPVPSLVEDDDGIRLLLCGPLIPKQAWLDASTSGAQGLVRVIGGPTAFVTTEVFASYRRENLFAAAYEMPEARWQYAPPSSFLILSAAAQAVPSTNPFVHLHTHSEFSALDGYATMDEIVAAVQADGQSAVAVTDHSVCAGHPALRKAVADTGVKAIYGMEANFVEDRFAREDTNDYRHLVLWGLDDEGLRNLWALSTEGYREGFYGRPRIDWDGLTRLNKGIAVSTACLRGPVLDPFLKGDEQKALQNLGRLGDIFADRLYIEIHANQLPEQLQANDWLYKVGRKYNIPLLAAVDSHYATPGDKSFHQTWLAMQTKSDVADDSSLFAGGQDYHLMGVDEVRQALSYLPADVVDETINSTGALAAQCTAEIQPKRAMPRFSRATPEHPDPARYDAERMVDMALANWQTRIVDRGKDPAPYLKQFQYEAPLMIEKGFPGYYLMTQDFVTWAKDHKILVGPGRGSGAASLLAYLLRITEVDPIEGELLFDRFMTKGRTSLPDFDIDFPTSKSDIMIDYIQDRWGPEHVAQVGTHLRIKNKSAFKDVQRAIASILPGDSFSLVVQISKIIDEAESSTAGLGLSWDDLFAQVGDLLEPYREKMPALFETAQAFRSRLKTYGRHAAGVIIDPDNDLYAELPMRNGEPGKPMVTQWDMDALEYVGKVKFDFLKLRNLDTIQDTIDLIEEETRDRLDVYSFSDEYKDPEVYQELGDGWTLGVFQIETNLGTRTTKLIRPQNLSELSDVITMGRPGPMRSGLDKLYLRRRSGEEPVTYADHRLEAILSKTFGCMLYQEDIMAVCKVLAGYDADEADTVRKILGKKKVELAEAEGRKFIQRAVENDTDRKVAEDIWAQMAEFAKYSFNRAHAYSYATLAFWTGWLKTHWARQKLTSDMASIDKDRIPAFVHEARRLGYEIKPPDINDSKAGFSASGLTIRYGLASVSGIGETAAAAILEAQPYASYEDFIARKGSKCNIGHVRRLVRIGAFDALVPNRRGLEYRIEADANGENTKCIFKDESIRAVNDLPCRFDWSSEPVKVGRTGKPLKIQPKPVAKCTRGCRHFTPREPRTFEDVEPYNEEQIRDIEFEMLGIYLSSSPFDRIPENVMSQLLTADELTAAEFGSYPMAVIVSGARPDPKGRDFGFVTLNTPAGDLSAIVFSRQWDSFKPFLRKGQMALVEIVKTDQDRFRLNLFQPL